ncbi:PRD domain-containing protein [Collinsella sp. zg1085]|uniref:PRD domain-containing protein n=1 Tax=Collinsella sp. zg1085 TaxID=2844380 RepID=UPI001C0BE28E|nr:PRD domain-containing protein [Collinsella sp. zg1085]QWT18217.1 PRD domain-containing protein [Collinsella sp. zg1085]
MRAIRRINNNVCVCIDGDGKELLAMGRGIGFGEMPKDLALHEIERTFYNVDSRYLSAINDLPQEVLGFVAERADHIRGLVPYQLSPNLVFLLADHIAFALKRVNQGIHVRMPLALDVEHTYPVEFRIGTHLVRQIRREFHVALPQDEAAAIAMNVVNARISEPEDTASARAQEDEEMFEDIIEIIEDEFGIRLDRSSFAFARYATHVRYLFERLHNKQLLDDSLMQGYANLENEYPEGFACVRKIAEHIAQTWADAELSEDEKFYLVVHVIRVCSKGAHKS